MSNCPTPKISVLNVTMAGDFSGMFQVQDEEDAVHNCITHSDGVMEGSR